MVYEENPSNEGCSNKIHCFCIFNYAIVIYFSIQHFAYRQIFLHCCFMLYTSFFCRGSAEEIDVAPIYHQLVDTYVSSESDVDVETQPGPSTQVTTRATRILPSRHFRKADDWKHEARALLEMLWHCEDSAPFRAPVDHIKHPGKPYTGCCPKVSVQ